MALLKLQPVMLICMWLLLPCLKATAAETISRYQHPYMGIHFGGAKTDNDNFHDSGSYGFFAGLYLLGNSSLEMDLIKFNRFDHKDLGDTKVEARAGTLSLAYRFDLTRWLALRPGVGVQIWDAKSYYLGYTTGEDNGRDLTANLSILFTIKKRVLLLIDTRWLNNVSGTDIWNASIGVGVNF